MKNFLPLSFLLLLSSLGFARPAVKVSLDTEIRRIDNMIMEIDRYESKALPIGIDGNTMRPDHFARFFADRDLAFKFFVKDADVSVGEKTVYQDNRKVLADYRAKIIRDEVDSLNQIIGELDIYQQEVSSPNFVGELPAADKYLLYFSEQRLPVQFEVAQGSISLASDMIYEKNMSTVNAYLSRLQKLQESSPAPVQ